MAGLQVEPATVMARWVVKPDAKLECRNPASKTGMPSLGQGWCTLGYIVPYLLTHGYVYLLFRYSNALEAVERVIRNPGLAKTRTGSNVRGVQDLRYSQA